MKTVVQCVHVRVAPSVVPDMTVAAHTRVTEWLTHWTCRGNFKAVIAESRDAGVARVMAQLQADLVPSWLARESGITPSMFEFEVAFSEVHDDTFWPSLSTVLCRWHRVKEPS